MYRLLCVLFMLLCLPSWAQATPVDDINQAAALIRNRDYAVAKPLLQGVASSANSNSEEKANAYYMLSIIEENAGDALTYAKKATELSPANSQFLLQYGALLYSGKHYPEAVAALTKAIEISPANDKAYSLRGIANRETGDLVQAIEDLDKAISLNGGAAIHYLRRGVLYYKLNKNDEALNDFETAARKGASDQQRGEILYYTGNILLRKNDLQQSENVLQNAYRLLSDEVKREEIKSIINQINAFKEWM
jgi:tetratricopeptide (TPR) repeat protein